MLFLASILTCSVLTLERVRAYNGFLATTNALMALEIANRGYVLGTGQVALADTAEALRDNEAVRKTYLGED